jgi:hypothetical protein
MMFLKAVSAARRVYPVITNGLKLYLDAYNLKSYSGSGSTWTDLSNSGYNFTIDGATWTVASGIRYFELDGVNDKIFGTNTTTLFDTNTTGWTWSMWVNHATAPQFLDVLINSEYLTAGKMSYYFDNRSTTSTGNGWRIGSYTDTSFTDRGVTLNQTITTNVWRHACVNFSYTTSTSGVFRIYLNGSLAASATQTLSGGLTWASFNSSRRPIIGAFAEPGGTFSRFNNIRVGEVLNYNRPLAASEVSDNYNATKSNYGL